MMKKKPNNVTIFGASHNGRSSTNAFHYIGLSANLSRKSEERLVAYVMLEDIIRNQRFVHTGIFIGFQMNESLFRQALMYGCL